MQIENWDLIVLNFWAHKFNNDFIYENQARSDRYTIPEKSKRLASR